MQSLELTLGVAREGLPASASDAGVAGACALAAAEGAALNVRINVPSITEDEASRRFVSRQEELLARARELTAQVRSAVDDVLNG